MKKKLTKENIKNWIKEHKAELAVIGLNAAAILLVCKWYYDAGFKNGVDASEMMSIQLIDDPECLIKHDKLPFEIKRKGLAPKTVTVAEGSDFVNSLNAFVKDSKG